MQYISIKTFYFKIVHCTSSSSAAAAATNSMSQGTKYQVEDDLDVDFFAALKTMQTHKQPDQQPDQSQDQQQPDQPNQSQLQQTHDNDNVCLITNEPLNAFHIVLACNHRFNYEPLYQEVLRQKGRFGTHNYYEKIGMYQIKCPYCRTFTNRLLPYIGPHPVIKRLNGVNAPASMCMPGVACSYGNSCSASAFYGHGSNPYCLRHYNGALKLALKNKTPTDTIQSSNHKCAAEIQTGKNKGKQCTLNAVQSDAAPPLCKKHSKCNVVLCKSS
jgi:hypothetical protein